MANRKIIPTPEEYDLAFDIVAEQVARSGRESREIFLSVIPRLIREMPNARWNAMHLHAKWRKGPYEERVNRVKAARERLQILNKKKSDRWKAINDLSSFIAVKGLQEIASKLKDGELTTRQQLDAVRLAMEIQAGAMGAAGKTVILTVNNINSTILDQVPAPPDIEGDPANVELLTDE